MRITNRYLSNNTIYHIQNNASGLARCQEQIGTSSKLNRPSDDPNVLGQFMSINATLSYNEQYAKNIDDGLSYLNTNDEVMDTIGEVLSDAEELTVQALNDSNNEADRSAIAAQIDKMIDMIIDLANSSVGDKYIYAGAKNSRPPFARGTVEKVDPTTGKTYKTDIVTYSGDFGGISREVLAGTDYRIDVAAINTPDSAGLFAGNYLEAIDDGSGNITYTVIEYDEYNHIVNDDSKGEGGIFKTLFDLRDRLSLKDATVPIEATNNAAQTSYQLPAITANPENTKVNGVVKFRVNPPAGEEPSVPPNPVVLPDGRSVYFSQQYDLDKTTPKSLISDGDFTLVAGTTDEYEITAGELKGLRVKFPAGINDNSEFTFTFTENYVNDQVNASLASLQQKTDHLLEQRVKVGARTKHFEVIKTQLSEMETKLNDNLKRIAGADIAKLSIEASDLELSYNASLAIGSTIMSTSLLNFLS
jgi:flagellar hook-associated protein 3 FlgL